MGIFNWISKKNKNDEISTKKEEITAGKAAAFNKAYDKVENWFFLLMHYVNYIEDNEKEIKSTIEKIKKKTNQDIKDELLLKDLLVFRYVNAFMWFFEFVNPPKDQNEVEINISLIDRAFKSVLDKNNKTDYFSELKKGFSEYIGFNELCFDNLEDFKKNYNKNFVGQIRDIAFESAGGFAGLSGQLNNFIIELIMTTLFKDRKVFDFEKDLSLTREEIEIVKEGSGVHIQQ